jgi:hypothetical protein
MSAERDWWSYSKREQKRLIEDAVDERLSREGELSDRQKLLLAKAIAHAFRGLFGLASVDIYQFNIPENNWAASARVTSEEVEGISPEKLRDWLEVLRGSPTQEKAIFC